MGLGFRVQHLPLAFEGVGLKEPRSDINGGGGVWVRIPGFFQGLSRKSEMGLRRYDLDTAYELCR